MNKILRILGKRGRITIPYELRQALGYKYNDLISLTPQPDGSILIQRETPCVHCADNHKKSPEEIFEEYSDEERKDAFVQLFALLVRKQSEARQ